jgi:membrane-anchored protein YejM (alkaline phosphatase superfamily)
VTQPPEGGGRASERLRRLLLFALANVAVTGVILARDLRYFPPGFGTAAWGAAITALISTSAFATLLPTLVLLPVAALACRRRPIAVASAFLFGVWQFALYADSVIYALFRFHLNGLVLNALTTPGAGDSILLGGRTYLSAVLRLTLLFGLEAALAAAVWSKKRQIEKAGSRVPVRAICALLGLVFLADKGIYAFATTTRRPEYRFGDDLFPLYVQVHVEESPLARSGKRNASTVARVSSRLRYPRNPVRLAANAPRPNVVLVAVEGLRFDMLDRNVMPFLTDWSAKQLVFRNHYSGGNSTRFGIFSLFYGLSGTYWNRFLAAARPPVLLDALTMRGYDFRILSCTDLNYPEFRETAFRHVGASIRDHWEGERVDRDRQMTDDLLGFLGRVRRPFFAFLFYDAPHGFYEYPPAFERFRPVPSNGDYVKLAAENPALSGPLFNRYRNSLGYVDSQIERVVRDLERRGLLENTLVFVTGDHGEEFGERGYRGHGGAFDRYQTSTLMVAHLPGEPAREVRRLTSHVDVVPTILERIGATNPPGDYSQGVPLTAPTGPSSLIVSAWREAAVIRPDSTVVFGLTEYAPFLHVYDREYRRMTRAEASSEKSQVLEEMARRMSEFSR